MRRAVGIAFHRDRRHVDDRSCRELLFDLLVLRLALGEPEPPAVIVDHDRDVILLSNAAALRSKVASSNFHCGEASFQISFAKSCVYFS